MAVFVAGAAPVVLSALLAAAMPDSPGQPLLEIKSTGGYRDASAPDPFVLLRVESDGRAGCHCNDRLWRETPLSKEEYIHLRETILQSGFLDLPGKSWLKRLNRLRPRMMDAPTLVYSARVNDRTNSYRFTPPADEEPEAVRQLRKAAGALRGRICRPPGNAGPVPRP